MIWGQWHNGNFNPHPAEDTQKQPTNQHPCNHNQLTACVVYPKSPRICRKGSRKINIQTRFFPHTYYLPSFVNDSVIEQMSSGFPFSLKKYKILQIGLLHYRICFKKGGNTKK